MRSNIAARYRGRSTRSYVPMGQPAGLHAHSLSLPRIRATVSVGSEDHASQPSVRDRSARLCGDGIGACHRIAAAASTSAMHTAARVGLSATQAKRPPSGGRAHSREPDTGLCVALYASTASLHHCNTRKNSASLTQLLFYRARNTLSSSLLPTARTTCLRRTFVSPHNTM